MSVKGIYIPCPRAELVSLACYSIVSCFSILEEDIAAFSICNTAKSECCSNFAYITEVVRSIDSCIVDAVVIIVHCCNFAEVVLCDSNYSVCCIYAELVVSSKCVAALDNNEVRVESILENSDCTKDLICCSLDIVCSNELVVSTVHEVEKNSTCVAVDNVTICIEALCIVIYLCVLCAEVSIENEVVCSCRSVVISRVTVNEVVCLIAHCEEPTILIVGSSVVVIVINVCSCDVTIVAVVYECLGVALVSPCKNIVLECESVCVAKLVCIVAGDIIGYLACLCVNILCSLVNCLVVSTDRSECYIAFVELLANVTVDGSTGDLCRADFNSRCSNEHVKAALEVEVVCKERIFSIECVVEDSSDYATYCSVGIVDVSDTVCKTELDSLVDKAVRIGKTCVAE